jgi:hypothetical protein
MARKRPQQRQVLKDWDFFSFPTFAGFSLGLFVAMVLAAAGPPFHTILFLAAMFCTSFSLAHLVTRFFTRRRLESGRAREEEEERERQVLAARQAGEAEPRRKRRRRR